MSGLDAAQSVARLLLAGELPQRWRHVQGVATRAQVFRHIHEPEQVELLTAACYVHDIGYASALVDTGFHPIDGARHLRRLRFDERIVGLVAHHTCAAIEAQVRGLDRELAREFPHDDSLPHDELCFCDLTTTPTGAIVTVEARLAEVRSRYGQHSIVRRFIDLAEPELVASVRRIEAALTPATRSRTPERRRIRPTLPPTPPPPGWPAPRSARRSRRRARTARRH